MTPPSTEGAPDDRGAPSPAALRYVVEDDFTGYGDSADRLVRGVRASGTRVEYRGWTNPLGGVPALLPCSRDEHPDHVASPPAPTVAHLVPEHYANVRAVLDDQGITGPLIGHTVWETDRAPLHWPALLNSVDRVIVPSEWNRDVFADSGVHTPISVIPHVACDPVIASDDAVTALGVPDDVVVFYSVGRWDERKAMFHVVRAFLDAFTADDPVVLVVKTGVLSEVPVNAWGTSSRLAYTTGWQVAEIVRHYPRPARVQLEVERWTSEQIAALHTRGDCFVGLARGEGWGMGAFDATAYGNPVVATGWGGYLEYLDADHAFLVEHALATVHHHAHGSYSDDQRWAEPSLEHATEQLRRVAADPAAARRRAAPLRDRTLREFAPNAVARRFLDALECSP